MSAPKIRVALVAGHSIVRHGLRRMLETASDIEVCGEAQTARAAMRLVRGYGVQIWPIVQDLNQLHDKYDKAWETFVGNCEVITSYGCRDNFTQKYLSENLGKESVDLTTVKWPLLQMPPPFTVKVRCVIDRLAAVVIARLPLVVVCPVGGPGNVVSSMLPCVQVNRPDVIRLPGPWSKPPDIVKFTAWTTSAAAPPTLSASARNAQSITRQMATITAVAPRGARYQRDAPTRRPLPFCDRGPFMSYSFGTDGAGVYGLLVLGGAIKMIDSGRDVTPFGASPAL